jgi:hypothetical protein
MKTSSFILLSILTIIPIAFAQDTLAQEPMHSMHHERHPEMVSALQELRAAKRDLEHGAHDFKGHRVAALQHTDAAISEVLAALESDRH